MEETTAIKLLRNVLLGEKNDELPLIRVQQARTQQRAASQTKAIDNQPNTIKPSQNDPTYISDDEGDNDEVRPRRSKRLAKTHRTGDVSPHLIVTAIPDLVIHRT